MISSNRQTGLGLVVLTWMMAWVLGLDLRVQAQELDPPPPLISRIVVSNGLPMITFAPYPAAEVYEILSSSDLNGPWVQGQTGSFAGFDWVGRGAAGSGFYRLEVTPVDEDVLYAMNLLNRIAYGPTPDEIARVLAMGPAAYLAEQLAPERIEEALEIDVPIPNTPPEWQYVSVTGTGSSSVLYVYLNDAGEGYLDDLKLVSGSVAGQGANLIRNGDFELPFTTNDWIVSENHSASSVTTGISHSGSRSLRMVASEGGTTRASSIYQQLSTALSSSQSYTLSYWFLPVTNINPTVTARLSGSGIVAESPSLETPGLEFTRLMQGKARIADLRSWHVRRAVESRKQLIEVLLQFLENHFVTQYDKTFEYFDRYYHNDDVRLRWASTETEYEENQRWREALMNPQCTFYDLLRISAESPAMVIYLDTVDSRGDGSNIANENYARELLELFTFGVDNGYDQNDIVEVSKVWTGWSVRRMTAANAGNPHAPDVHGQATNDYHVVELGDTWALKYRASRHSVGSKLIFPGKTVPDRFGPPWAGRNYELRIPSTTSTSTNGFLEGYTVIRHLADQPFTQEFISVKLCRLLVHDGFELGMDFTDPGLGAEGRLIRECMVAWESGNPKGQIRKVLEVILESELFRKHGGSMQKIKSPLEFVVSAIRALHGDLGNGQMASSTDGFVDDVLERMGSMSLFNRPEPDGYPEAGPSWINAGTLAERLRFIQSYLTSPTVSGRPGDAGECYSDPAALIRARLPQSQWSDAGAVADYILAQLFLSEGRANLDLYRTAAIGYLNTADNGTSSSPFSALGTGSANYDTRVRGMVAMLMTFPRFQEQ